MGEALIAGLLKSGHWKPSQIVVCDIRHDQLVKLQRRYKVRTSADSRRSVCGASVILLAVKPQHMKDVLEDLGPVIKKNQLVLSIAAGVTTAMMESFLAKGVPLVRVMPNTPALVGLGMAALARGKAARQSHLRMAMGILGTVGAVVSIPERAMDAVTAVSGSGPAYIFYVAEAMKDAAITMGLAPQVADQLVRQTIRGAGVLLAQSQEELKTLRARVTSPGGTTEAALKIMERAKVRAIFQKALTRAQERSRELSQLSH